MQIDQPIMNIKNSFEALQDDVENGNLIAAMNDLKERSKEFESDVESIYIDAALKVPDDFGDDAWFDDEDILETADARPYLSPLPHWTEILGEIQERDRRIESKMIRCDHGANFAEHPIGSSGVSPTTADEEGREIGDNPNTTFESIPDPKPIGRSRR